MDLDDALTQLGLPIGAPRDQIEARFRELAKEHHPDAGGDSDEYVLLTEARAAALAASSSTALVPIGQIQELVRASMEPFREEIARREARDERRESRAALLRQTVRLGTDRHRALTRVATIAAAFAGVVAALNSRAITANLLDLDPILSPWLVAALAAFAVVSAGVAALARYARSALEEAIRDVSDGLDDKTTFVDLLYEIVNASPPDAPWRRPPWTSRQLRALVRAWLRSTSRGRADEDTRLDRVLKMYTWPFRRSASMLQHTWLALLVPHGFRPTAQSVGRRIGSTGFVKLITAKGIDHGLLEETEWQEDGLPRMGYKPRFALNGPEGPPATVSPEPERRDANAPG